MRFRPFALTALLGSMLCLECMAGTSRAANPHTSSARTPEQVIAHHFAAIAARNLNEIAGDYADDAMLITAEGVTRGKAAIRSQFARLVRPPKVSGGVRGRPASLRILRQRFASDVAWLMWVRNAGMPNEVRGVETYIVHNGKITLETVGTVRVHATAP